MGLNKNWIIALPIAGIMFAAGCGKKDGGGAAAGNLAVVNGEEISMAEFHNYLERKQLVQVVTQTGASELPVVGSLGFQALRDLVNRRILLQIAKDDKVYPTEADVAKELEFQTKRKSNFVQQLMAQGMTVEQIRSDILLDIARERVLTKGITVGLPEAEKYIKENPAAFSTPAQAKLSCIVVPDAKAKGLAQTDLNQGKSFATVAAAYSVLPGARQNMGAFPETVIDRMSPALQALVKKTPEGRVTDWQPEGDKFVKFFVQQKVDAKPVPIDDTMKEYVRRQLALQRGAAATDLGKRLVEKLKGAKVSIGLKSLQSPWDTAFKNLTAQDVQQGTSSAAGAGTKPADAPK